MKSKNNKIIVLFLFFMLTILLTGMVYATTDDNIGDTSSIGGLDDMSESASMDKQDSIANVEKNNIITENNDNNMGHDSTGKSIEKNTDITASKTVPANVTYSGEDTDSYDKIMDLIETNDDAQELIIELNNDKVYTITDSIIYSVHKNIKTVTIIGNSAVLEGKGKESFIVVDEGNTLNLKNLTVRNTYGSMGSAINSRGIVNVEDCVFEDNIALYNGGAIVSFGPLTVNRTLFTDNSVTTSIKYGLENYGGGAISASGPLVVDNSVFVGNLAAYDDSGTIDDAANGGAIFVLNTTSDVSITNSNFTANIAGVGGAVEVYDSQFRDEGVVLFDSNNFNENSAYQGGAILLVHSAIVTNNIFTENKLNNENVNIVPFGAAIELFDDSEKNTCKLTSSANMFKSNDAGNYGFGGAIDIGPGMVLDSSSNVYEDNKALFGGAISSMGSVTVTDDSFTDNSALYNGGAIYSLGSLTVNRTRFNNNSITTSINARENDNGGGAITASGSLVVDYSVFAGNMAAYDDSGDENDGASAGAIFVLNSDDDVSITNSNFTDNGADLASAIFVYDSQYRDEGVVLIDSNNFIKNNVHIGGTIILQHSAIVSNNNFTENRINTQNINNRPMGAAIVIYDEKGEKTYKLTLLSNTFKGNDAGDVGEGGAIGISPGMILDSSRNVFENNKAASGGSIISWGNVTVTDDSFTDNSALYNGGAIYSLGSLTVNRTRFTDNSVTTSTDGMSNHYGGGAIFAYGSLIVDNSVFTGNLAAYDDFVTANDTASGGAIYVFNSTGDVSITNSNFTGNTAGVGGAVVVYDPQCRDEGVVLIDSNNFNENSAYQGGAILLMHSAIVTNNIFTENRLNENVNVIPFGAAIELFDDKFEKTYTLTSSGNTFKSNDAGNKGYGGAIDIGWGMVLYSSSNVYEDNKAAFGGAISSMGNVTVTDDKFTDNTAIYNGGAVYSYGPLNVNSSTFVNNKVTTSYNSTLKNYGGGAIMASGQLVIDDSVFTGNLAAYDDSGSENDGALGGAILVFNSTDDVSITNSRFTFNEAGYGGALVIYDPQYRDEGNVLIDSNNFNNNRAYWGGAIALQHSVIATNNNFTENEINNRNNNTSLAGSAIVISDELGKKSYMLTLSNNTFRANDAGNDGIGGAVYVNYGMLLDSRNNIYDNNNAFIAGAIFNAGNATLCDDTFTGNTASYAGAIENLGEISVTNCTFNDNKAEVRVDTLYTNHSVMIKDSTFHTDNLERLVGTNNRPLIFATDNIVNDEFLEEGLIKSTLTLTLNGTDLVLDKDNIISGNLIDATGVPIFNKTVDLYVNNIKVASSVTDENGEFTFTYMPTGGSGADIQVKFTPNDHYLVSESAIIPVKFVKNDSNTTQEPKPIPKEKSATKNVQKKVTKNSRLQTAKHTHTIRLASDNSVVWTGNTLTLEALNNIFDLNFTNGHLLVYIDGVLVFNDTVDDDLSTIIIELLDKYLGEHEIKVIFTDNENNTDTYKENVII